MTCKAFGAATSYDSPAATNAPVHGWSACPSPSRYSVPSPETTNSTSSRSSLRRGAERPAAKWITRCSSRSQPLEASIVVRTSAVSPAARAPATSCSAMTKPSTTATEALSSDDPRGASPRRRGGARLAPRVRRRARRRPVVSGLRRRARRPARLLRGRAPRRRRVRGAAADRRGDVRDEASLRAALGARGRTRSPPRGGGDRRGADARLRTDAARHAADDGGRPRPLRLARISRDGAVPLQPDRRDVVPRASPLERLDLVAEANAPGLLDLAEDAEVDVLAALCARPAVALDLAQRVEVGGARLRALRRDRAACDLLVQADDGLADADETAEPGVFLVRLAARDADQHPETARVDAVAVRVPGELLERRVREHRHRPEAAIDSGARLVGADEPHRSSRVARDRLRPLALDDASRYRTAV